LIKIRNLLVNYTNQPIVKLRFTIENRAYRRLPKSVILAAPLGARARLARRGGVFSVGKAAEKTIFIVLTEITIS
jgi:hypothetical protein